MHLCAWEVGGWGNFRSNKMKRMKYKGSTFCHEWVFPSSYLKASQTLKTQCDIMEFINFGVEPFLLLPSENDFVSGRLFLKLEIICISKVLWEIILSRVAKQMPNIKCVFLLLFVSLCIFISFYFYFLVYLFLSFKKTKNKKKCR